MCSGDSASDFFFSRRYNAPNGMCTRILLRQRLLPLPPGALNTSLVVTSRIGRLPAMTRGRYDRVHWPDLLLLPEIVVVHLVATTHNTQHPNAIWHTTSIDNISLLTCDQSRFWRAFWFPTDGRLILFNIRSNENTTGHGSIGTGFVIIEEFCNKWKETKKMHHKFAGYWCRWRRTAGPQ